MKQREIECLDRLLLLHPCLDDIVEFLLQEKIMDPSELPYIARDVNKSKYVYNVLQTAKAKDKIMLLDFEWLILPIERIKITIVTERTSKEFSYGQ